MNHVTSRRRPPMHLCGTGVILIASLGAHTVAHEGHAHASPARVTWERAGLSDVVTSASATSRLGRATTIDCDDPLLTAWRRADGSTGTSDDQSIFDEVSDVLADIATIAFDDDWVYVRTSGIPSHPVGPFGNGLPSNLGDLDATYRVSRHPEPETGEPFQTLLGSIGVMVNGATFFNASDGHHWDPDTGEFTPGLGAWNVNALWFRAPGMDDAAGHPAPPMGPGGGFALYHYHRSPVGLLMQLDPDNTGDHHSPIIGFAFDGYPVYGPWAYANGVNDGEGYRAMTSSWQVGDDSVRGANGPSATEFEMGSFIEDFVYVEGAGTLNQFNMAFVHTPEYPDGTWAYFVTEDQVGQSGQTDLDGAVSYPYILGPRYFGVVDRQSVL
ncbi:MAG: YHYH protein, partial [Phycisphaerales bacterium]|nr:YHYH protein [Phycisphaerales bacterium]